MAVGENKGGRPITLTPEVQLAVCEKIAEGNYLETAASLAGVPPRTLRRWLQRGHDAVKRKVRNPFRRFLEAVEQAQAEGEAEHVGAIRAARSEHWQASAWWLERTRPERFGRRDKVLVENSVREELEQALTRLEQRLPPEEYDRVLAALAAGDDGEGASAAEGLDAANPH